METYLKPLILSIRQAANSEKAIGMKKYMKDQFEFIGVDAPTRKEIVRNFQKEYGSPDKLQLNALSIYLWNQPEREFQHLTIDILQKQSKYLQKGDIIWLEKLLISKSWWDTVDGLSGWICGTYFQLFPEEISAVTSRWMDSGNLWLQRSCLLFQLKYKTKTNTVLLAQFIEQLKSEKNFFIRKAIGWSLREYAKTDASWVKSYVQQIKLPPLSIREATKHI